jgi:hypothetical protein
MVAASGRREVGGKVEKAGEMATFGRCVGDDPRGVESKDPKGGTIQVLY